MFTLCVRILDDLQDRDRQDALWADAGVSRAFNFSAAVYTLSIEILRRAPLSTECYRAVNRGFVQTALHMAYGQDCDLRGDTRTVEAYWRCIEGKTASAYGMACAAGAMVGTEIPSLVDTCRQFGRHLGYALQIFDDLEAIWQPHGLSDLAQGKFTLPIIYALTVEHSYREELGHLIDSHHVQEHEERIRTILDNINTREFMIWAALQKRKQALSALEVCPASAGVAALTAYIDTVFAHVERLLP